MNGIKQVGLTNAISAAYANNSFGKIEFLMGIVLELKYRYGP